MDLTRLRKKIDEVDSKIIGLLNDRTRLAREIGRKKIESGKAVYVPEREFEIYQKIEQIAGKGELPGDALKAIYREIMSAALAMEKPLVIAYLGPEATFTHLAALSKFGTSVSYKPCASFAEIFREVEMDRADYGVVPIENSIEGAVNHTLDMFIDSELKICSEIFFEISHNLMTNASSLNQVKRVYSKAEVFGQCRLWIEANLHHAERMETSSTAAAAGRAAREDGAAAIGSRLAATLHNLPVMAEAIQDIANNVTRFLVISKQVPAMTRHDKTSIVVSIRDKVGALYEMLLPIKKFRINMTKIESRPSRKKAWDYYFFIDLEGHVENERVRKMLEAMEPKVKFLKVLGSYPAMGRPKA
ncbi:MAG: P-protein [Candidatus Omnitrophica bacterium ADurb.Bin292]|jgi:chorismate mutase/prephenate dehydratase|nr:MAG: P-protein [Candidatus Omnitrophica bacterium ADurb.Bin292]HOG23284.1 prephenate dehydratase [Candidatus Omnitrophota bacterium]HPW77119.1 prephenate dehydratase [Candidatus Omnitrophota bacterium]HQB12272.1 prephenate dehydratase [Candidatus Omnitrophota bacterium]